MANSKAISIRIPDELLEKIDQLAEEKYKSHKGTPNRSLVVLDAIVAYFGTLSDTETVLFESLVSDSVSINDFNGLREEFIALKDIVKIDKNPPEQNQLSIISVPDSVEELNGKELAKRLGVNESDISTKKNNLAVDEFVDWTRTLPTNINKTGWTYKPKDKGRGVLYFPIKPLA
jgi:hypothetical protein